MKNHETTLKNHEKPTQLTSFDPKLCHHGQGDPTYLLWSKSLTLRTRGPNQPFRCLDFLYFYFKEYLWQYNHFLGGSMCSWQSDCRFRWLHHLPSGFLFSLSLNKILLLIALPCFLLFSCFLLLVFIDKDTFCSKNESNNLHSATNHQLGEWGTSRWTLAALPWLYLPELLLFPSTFPTS